MNLICRQIFAYLPRYLLRDSRNIGKAFKHRDVTMSGDNQSASDDLHSSGDPASKRICNQLKIGTHDGVFHCDEVLACSLLKCLPEYENASIIRTRDPKLLETCDIVVDVGGVYDPEIHRYDHHQRTFTESMHSLDNKYPWTTKLSSAGLVYYHFGKRIIAKLLNEACHGTLVQNLYIKLYENFLQEIDGIDNGEDICEGVQRYKICTNLSSRVRMLNVAWNEKNVSNDTRFYQASDMVLQEFRNCMLHYATVWWPAKQIVAQSVADRYTVHESGRIMELQIGGCPWKEHLYSIEDSENLSPKIDFVIYSDLNGAWRVQAVNISSSSFHLRVPLKEEWRGLRDEELSNLSGIPECIFVHSSGFIGGSKTREGAMQMALKTLGIEQ